jgi:hypothetical protein
VCIGHVNKENPTCHNMNETRTVKKIFEEKLGGKRGRER